MALSDSRITHDPLLMTHASDGPWYYEQIALGYNYRMTDLQAALVQPNAAITGLH